MSKLEYIVISDTDIDSGLEYLPESLKEFECSAKEKKDAKCQTIKEQLAPYNNSFVNWKHAQKNKQIQLLRKQNQLFAEKEQEISHLEWRVKELINLIKTQKQKIIQDFLNILPERELIQQLITTYLEFKKAEKHNTDNTLDLEDEYMEIKRELRRKLGTEFVKKIQPILSDCEELVIWELELEERLKGKTFLIEEQKQTLKQITDGNENNRRIVEKQEKADQKQREQLQEAIFQENYLKNQLGKVEELTQQSQIIYNPPRNN